MRRWRVKECRKAAQGLEHELNALSSQGFCVLHVLDAGDRYVVVASRGIRSFSRLGTSLGVVCMGAAAVTWTVIAAW